MLKGNRKDINLILLGKSGSGKSATGNTLAGQKVFESRPGGTGVTKTPQMTEVKWGKRNLKIVDTPGIFDNTMTMSQVMEEIVNAVSLCSPGPHAFLIVLAVGRFTPEEYDAVQKLQELFGPTLIEHSIILLTRVDDLKRDGMTVEQYIESAPPELQDLKELCGNRLFAVDNTDPDASRQARDKLVNFVEYKCDEKIARGEEPYYTIDMIDEANNEMQRAKEELEAMVEEQVKGKEHQLAANLASRLKRLHDQHREILRLQEITRQTIKNWVALRSVTIDILQSLKNKGKLTFESDAEQQVKRLRRKYPWAALLIRLYTPFLWLFSLKKLYTISESDIEQLTTMLETDDKQTTILADTLGKMEKMKSKFSVPATPTGLEGIFDPAPFEVFQAKLLTMPAVSLSEEQMQCFGLNSDEVSSEDMPSGWHWVSVGRSSFLEQSMNSLNITTRRLSLSWRNKKESKMCVRVKPYLQKALDKSGSSKESRSLVDTELDKICAMLTQDLKLKQDLHGHWFHCDTSESISWSSSTSQ